MNNVLIWLMSVLVASAASADSQPNVLLVLTDDQGHGDLGFHQNPTIHTPPTWIAWRAKAFASSDST